MYGEQIKELRSRLLSFSNGDLDIEVNPSDPIFPWRLVSHHVHPPVIVHKFPIGGLPDPDYIIAGIIKNTPRYNGGPDALNAKILAREERKEDVERARTKSNLRDKAKDVYSDLKWKQKSRVGMTLVK